MVGGGPNRGRPQNNLHDLNFHLKGFNQDAAIVRAVHFSTVRPLWDHPRGSSRLTRVIADGGTVAEAALLWCLLRRTVKLKTRWRR